VYPPTHEYVHELFTQAGTALATPVVHTWPQAPQLLASFVVLTQALPQSVGVAAAQLFTHEYVEPEPEHSGVPAGHTLPQPPQLLTLEMSVSQPVLGFVVQCAHPAAQVLNWHTPPLHVVEPATCASAEQSKPQLPQFFASLWVLVQTPPQLFGVDPVHTHPPPPLMQI
jgi:hypothetical protein